MDDRASVFSAGHRIKRPLRACLLRGAGRSAAHGPCSGGSCAASAFTKAIDRLGAPTGDRSRLLEQLARPGGTRAWWVAIAPLLVVCLSGVAAGIAVPMYQDAATRQQMRQAAEPGR
ncbi:hypothetical protein [Aquincola tertiaricarbonis]|uniref:hypothetical protein n=1 Tax=Aquincola tertiaricarbonis TaxID=391953 RepID=UPI0012EEACFE|nr:hypothetical protein [Aquincola tertiaricarbonis]